MECYMLFEGIFLGGLEKGAYILSVLLAGAAVALVFASPFVAWGMLSDYYRDKKRRKRESEILEAGIRLEKERAREKSNRNKKAGSTNSDGGVLHRIR
jgi:hypothetical protein